MANVAVNAAIIAAAAQQQAATKAVTDQLKGAKALNARHAISLDLSAKGADKAVEHLLAAGQVRSVGGGRYWLDEEAVARSKASATRIALIICAGLASIGASVLALLSR